VSPVKEIETTKGTLQVFYDDTGYNPLEDWDQFGTVYHYHPRYKLGTRISREDALPKGVRLPLFLFDHSGLHVSTSPFGDPWDSGQVGWIVANEEKVKEEFGCKRITPTIRRKVIAILQSQVKTLDAVLSGSVYGFKLLAPQKPDCPHCGAEQGRAVTDSCWGFIGDLDELIPDMLYHVGAEVK